MRELNADEQDNRIYTDVSPVPLEMDSSDAERAPAVSEVQELVLEQTTRKTAPAKVPRKGPGLKIPDPATPSDATVYGRAERAQSVRACLDQLRNSYNAGDTNRVWADVAVLIETAYPKPKFYNRTYLSYSP